MDRRQLLERTAAAGAAGLTSLATIELFDSRNSRIDREGRSPTSTADGGTGKTTAPATATETSATTPEQTEELSPAPDQTPVRHQDEFGTVVDAVRAGADPKGEQPIDDFLQEYADDDTLLSFPAGTYLLPQTTLKEYDHLGISTAGDERPTFVSPSDDCSDPHVRFELVSDFLLEGIDFDFQREGAGGSVGVIASGDATVRDVTSTGGCANQISMFRVDIRDPEGTGLVENLSVRSGQTTGWLTGIYVGKDHSGTVTFRDCELDGFSDNGLYGSAPALDDGGGGTVHTENGRYRNNNVSNIRLGSPGSTARGDAIVVESAPEAESINLRGIRLRRGSGQEVEDCTIRFGPSATDSFGAIVFHADNGGARVADSRVTMDADNVPAVKAFYHESDAEGAPTFENLTVDGDASRGYAVQVNGRDGTTFRNCTIEQSGNRRDGIRLAYSKECELVDSRIDVTGFPLILRDSTLRIRNTTFVTPEGEHHVDEMEAEPGDFRPGSWETESDG